MVEPVSLLPQNATRWETAHELTDATRWAGLDPAVISRTKDALLVDERLLPVLAWERSVDIYYDGQSLGQRRLVTDESYALHRLKGTKAGLKRYIELAGGKVRRIIAPPRRAFPGRSMTAAERAAWLAKFRQLRVYKYRDRGASRHGLYIGRNKTVVFSDRASMPASAACLTAINSAEFIGRRAFLRDGNTETALKVWTRRVTAEDKTVALYDWIVLPGHLNGCWFMGQMKARLVPTARNPIATRTLSVKVGERSYRDQQVSFDDRGLTPGLRPILLNPERVAERGLVKPGEWYLGRPQAYLVPRNRDQAPEHLYERLYLHEFGRGPIPRPATARFFMGHDYMLFPAYNARALVEIKLKLPARSFLGRWKFFGGYLHRADMAPLWRIAAAVRSAKSARDRVLLDTRAHAKATARFNLLAGDVIAGQYVETL